MGLPVPVALLISSPVAAPQGTELFVESSSADGSLRVVATQVGGEDGHDDRLPNFR
ncbi:hypothetical protein [Streptomyces sp. NPDC058625]|uniref:hypothetical protein n=1 Tax=Streptomyces sp. NPDC058625 TaxID=3346564 RepID=UPI00364B06A9